MKSPIADPISRMVKSPPVSSALHAVRRAGPASLALAGVFVALSLAEGHSAGDIALGLACGLFVLFAGFALFCMGWVESSDAKLFAGIAVWVGWSHLWMLCLGALLFGAALHPAFRWWRSRPLPENLSGSGFWRDLHHRRAVPLSLGAAMTALFLTIAPHLWFGNLLGS